MSALHNLEAERAILSALSSVSASQPVEALTLLESTRLQADDFALQAHGDVFSATADLLRRGVPLDLFALEAALGPSPAVTRAGGRKWLAPLVLEASAEGRSVPELARLVRESAYTRRALAAATALCEQLRDGQQSAPEVVANAATVLSGLANRDVSLHTAEGDALRLAEMLDAAQSGRRELVLPSGVELLDKQIGGLQPAVLTLVGALPGVGKSALLSAIARNLSNEGRKVGFFSLEDERGWVARRLLSVESGVPLFLLTTKALTPNQAAKVEEAMPRVYETLRRLVIVDRPAMTPIEIVQAAHDMVLNHGCRAIFIDHLGEVKLDRSERYDLDIADALAAFRDLAKRHNVPVVVASHVKRRAGLGIEDAPYLTDFANSSAPERMARVALGLSKPFDGCVRVSVLKQTNGVSGQAIDLALVSHAAMVDNEREAEAPQGAE